MNTKHQIKYYFSSLLVSLSGTYEKYRDQAQPSAPRMSNVSAFLRIEADVELWGNQEAGRKQFEPSVLVIKSAICLC